MLRENWWRRALFLLAAGIFAEKWLEVIIKPRGDFLLHWELGRRFLAGEFLYPGGFEAPYLPFWAMVHAPLTLLPPTVAQTLLYPLSALALAVLLLVLNALTRGPAGDKNARLSAAILAVVMASGFLMRDLAECGVNLAILALTWASIYMWSRHRDCVAGTCLGLATALKCTPVLFLVYFAWKRQWRITAAGAIATLIFVIAPMTYQGSSVYALHMKTWAHSVWRGVASPDPSKGTLGEEKLQNFALRPALARFLMRLPDGHLSRLPDRWYIDFIDLPPFAAGIIVKTVMATLLAAIAWAFRRIPPHRDDPKIFWECAAVSVLILLYSPITWSQHCVGVLPAFYLIMQASLARGPMTRWTAAFLSVWVVLILVLNRTFTGAHFTLVMQSYHTTTWALLALLLITARYQSWLEQQANQKMPVAQEQIMQHLRVSESRRTAKKKFLFKLVEIEPHDYRTGPEAILGSDAGNRDNLRTVGSRICPSMAVDSLSLEKSAGRDRGELHTRRFEALF